jgi:hypothetical protein
MVETRQMIGQSLQPLIAQWVLPAIGETVTITFNFMGLDYWLRVPRYAFVNAKQLATLVSIFTTTCELLDTKTRQTR